MKAYIVNVDSEFDTYLLYPHEIPTYDEKAKRWFGFGDPIAILEEDIPKTVKLPEKGKIAEVNILIVGNERDSFYKGCTVRYKVFSWSSFIFGGMIYGGCDKIYVTEVLGIDWLNGKILVQKHNSKKPKWYDWSDFEIVE